MARSAGLLLFRRARHGIEVLLAHPGGPLWAGRDEGAWSIPKGEPNGSEDLLDTARREFREETGHDAPAGEPLDLGEIRLRSGKLVHAWALEGDLDPGLATSTAFELEWPPRSGRLASFPEVDRVGWFDGVTAAQKLNSAQGPFVERLLRALRDASPD